jgi:hypothetical protein
MDKALLFIQQCTRTGIDVTDLGYITKWYFEIIDRKDNPEKELFPMIQSYIDGKFFEKNHKIQRLLTEYTDGI